MEKDIIIEKINEFLIDEFEVDEDDLTNDANLKDTLELDSLDFVDLVVAVDTAFSVKLIAEDFKGVETLEHFYNLIDKKVNVQMVG